MVDNPYSIVDPFEATAFVFPLDTNHSIVFAAPAQQFINNKILLNYYSQSFKYYRILFCLVDQVYCILYSKYLNFLLICWNQYLTIFVPTRVPDDTPSHGCDNYIQFSPSPHFWRITLSMLLKFYHVYLMLFYTCRLIFTVFIFTYYGCDVYRNKMKYTI